MHPELAVACQCWSLLCVLFIAACGPGPPPPSIGYASPDEPATEMLVGLSRNAEDTGSFPVFADTIYTSYDRVFDAAVHVLKSQGDIIVQADSDKGYIVTDLEFHGSILYQYWTQHFIILNRMSDMQTRMVFKLCSYYWDDVNYPTSMYVRAPNNTKENYRISAQFVQAVRISAMQ